MMNKVEFTANYEVYLKEMVKSNQIDYTTKDEEGKTESRTFKVYTLVGLLLTREFGEDRISLLEVTVDNGGKYGRVDAVELMSQMMNHMPKLITGETIAILEVDHVLSRKSSQNKNACGVFVPYLKSIKFAEASPEDKAFINVMKPLYE